MSILYPLATQDSKQGTYEAFPTYNGLEFRIYFLITRFQKYIAQMRTYFPIFHNML